MNYKKSEIELLANKYRRILGIDSIGILNIFDLCTDEFYFIRYPVGEQSIMGAALIKNNDKIIFSNSSYILSREIFTVAHEIGHFALEHVNSNNQSHHDATVNNSNQEEKDANYFAVCFLMPKEKVEEFIKNRFQYDGEYNWTSLEIASIMTTFRVSYEVAINRLNQLGLISEEQHFNLQQQKSEIKISKMLKAIGGAQELCFPQNTKQLPIDFLRWVKSNYQNGVISTEIIQKAVSYLDAVSLEDFEIVKKVEEDDFDLDAFLEGEDE